MTPGAPEGFFRRSSAALALLLFYGALTLWVRERWALSLLEAGVFLLGIV